MIFTYSLQNKLRDINIMGERIFEELSKIRVAIIGDNGLKGPQVVVETMSTTGAMIFSKLDLGRYLKGNSF